MSEVIIRGKKSVLEKLFLYSCDLNKHQQMKLSKLLEPTSSYLPTIDINDDDVK